MLRYCMSSCTSSHIWCYATVCRLALPHVYDATLLHVVLHFLTYMMLRYCMSSCTSSHTWCYATVCRLALSRNISDLKWPADRPCGWRCLSRFCGHRMLFLSLPIFCGLRCGPLGLQKMLLQYCKLNLNQCPRVTDMVQNTGFGETCCRHFLNSLRTLEAEAGRRICETKKLRTKVEVDATNLLVFARTACTWRMFKTLSFLLKIPFRATAVYQACT